MTIPRIVVTAGEPAGIGPDLCVLFAQYEQAYDWVVIADPQVLLKRAALLKQPLKILIWQPGDFLTSSPPGIIKVWPIRMNPVEPGQLDTNNVPAVLKSLEMATKGCMDGEFNAMMTGPVHKGIINEAGTNFTGHTEFLAQLTKTKLPVMMLEIPQLRVALVTTHLPLSEVSAAITKQRLLKTIQILWQDLHQRFHIAKPRILVSGLNPHAGEGGHLGHEEIEIIAPAIKQCQDKGMDIQGPFSADTLFTPDRLEQADVILAMYHDQGLTVLKHLGFGKAVNITLGLPIIRTSVDHGTALEKAGHKKQINLNSFRAAMGIALHMQPCDTIFVK